MLRIAIVAMTLLLISALPARAALCSVDIGTLDFAQVDTLGDTATLTGTPVTIHCDGVTPGETLVTVCGSLGAGSGGAVGGLRRALSGDETLGFILSVTDGGGVPWGSLSAPELGAPRTITLNVDQENHTASRIVQLYGVVPEGQSAAPVGAYSADFNGADASFTYDEGDLDCNVQSGSGDASVSFTVTASVAANCRLETSDLNFGTTGKIGDNIDGETAMSILCTAGTGYGIAIDGGGSGDTANRRLVAGENSVRYDLYSNSQRSARWGMDEGDMVNGDGDGTAQQYWVYGRIPPQPAATGAYTDTVVVTLFYE